jgi:hypothetical protein
MSENHTVLPGEYMELIAWNAGFPNYTDILADAKNEAFKKLRPNPDILMPGDQVFIPDKDTKGLSAATDKKHKVVKKGPPKIELIVTIQRYGKPFGNQKFLLEVGDKKIPGHTAANGLLKTEIPLGVALGTLTFPGPPVYKRKLNFGFLNPITTVSGRQMRLNNLGFFCGPANGVENAAYKAALAAFQKKYLPIVTGDPQSHMDLIIDTLRSQYDSGRPS